MCQVRQTPSFRPSQFALDHENGNFGHNQDTELNSSWLEGQGGVKIADTPKSVEFVYLRTKQDPDYPDNEPSHYLYEREKELFDKYFLDKLLGGKESHFAQNTIIKLKIEKFAVVPPNGFPKCTMFKYTLEDLIPQHKMLNNLNSQEHQPDAAAPFMLFLAPSTLETKPGVPNSRLERTLVKFAAENYELEIADSERFEHLRKSDRHRLALFHDSHTGNLKFSLQARNIGLMERRVLVSSLVKPILDKAVFTY